MSCDKSFSNRKSGHCLKGKVSCASDPRDPCNAPFVTHKIHNKSKSNHLTIYEGDNIRKVNYDCIDEMELLGDLVTIEQDGSINIGGPSGYMFFAEAGTGPMAQPGDPPPIGVRSGDVVRIWSRGGNSVNVKPGSALVNIEPQNIFVTTEFPPPPPPDPTRPVLYYNCTTNETLIYAPGPSGAVVFKPGATGAQGSQGPQGYHGVTGPQGFQGPQGVTGSQGQQGNAGTLSANCFEYDFSTNTAGTDPGTGNIKVSDSPIENALNVYINNSDKGSNDISAFISCINDINSVVKGNVKIEKKSNSEIYAYYDITSIVDNSGWYTLSGMYSNGTTGNPFSDGEDVAVCLIKNGQIGATGSQGYQGVTGPDGVTGFQGFQGVTGSQGFQGFQGVTGSQGFQGSTGLRGSTGIPGIDGATGYQGYMPCTPNPVAYWPMNEGIGTLVEDFGNPAGDNNGTLNGGWSSGHLGSNSTNFSLISHNITAPNVGLPIGNSARSINLWFRTPASDPNQTLIGYGSVGTNQQCAITLINLNQILLTFWNNDFEPIVGPFATNTWHHIVVTYDGTTNVQIYFNGVVYNGVLTNGIPNTSSGAVIMAFNPGDFEQQFIGQLDDVAIYDCVLSSAEVAHLYNGGVGKRANSLYAGPVGEGYVGVTGAQGPQGATGHPGLPGATGTTVLIGYGAVGMTGGQILGYDCDAELWVNSTLQECIEGVTGTVVIQDIPTATDEYLAHCIHEGNDYFEIFGKTNVLVSDIVNELMNVGTTGQAVMEIGIPTGFSDGCKRIKEEGTVGLFNAINVKETYGGIVNIDNTTDKLLLNLPSQQVPQHSASGPSVELCYCLCGQFVGFPIFSEDFESMSIIDPGALQPGWKFFANVYTDSSKTTPLYSYGVGPAPNGTGGFSQLVTGQGGPEQGTNQLSIFSDYNNGDHGNPPIFLETSIFQQYTFVAGDAGKTFTYRFDAKRGDLAGASRAYGYLVVFSPGFSSILLDLKYETTATSNTEWNTYSLQFVVDPSWVGNPFQYGFQTQASGGEPSGVFYDNPILCS